MLLHRKPLAMALLLALIASLAAPLTAFAHPLGNFTISRYSRLELGDDQIRVRYVIDMAEIPAFQERARIDLNDDDVLSAAEQDRYLAEETATLQRNLHLTINGQEQLLEVREPLLEFLPGQGGLQTLRLSLWLAAPLSLSAVWHVDYRDDNFADRIGWQEIIVKATGRVAVRDSIVATQDLSDELRRYPQDLLQNPPAVSQVEFQFAPAVTASIDQSSVHASGAMSSAAAFQTGRTSDRFTELIAMADVSAGAILAAMLIAFAWGAAHAFSPGHGKTIVAAYLVGSRATIRHALFLGATTTVTHMTGVFALGLITLFASRYIVPEQLFPWLEVISGALLIALGVSLFVNRLRRVIRPDQAGSVHDHDHDHAHGNDHDHHHHAHRPPSSDAAPVTWRSLLALGISGGLLPCPSALVVMLGAIALNRIALGLLLIVVFSLGLAGTLTSIGILMVHAKGLLTRFATDQRWPGRLPFQRRVIQVLPAISALFILIAGASIVLAALTQAGVLQL